jgi:hypothetical protein
MQGRLAIGSEMFLTIVHMFTRTFKFSMAWHNTTDVSLMILHLSCLPLLNYYGRQKLLSGQYSANMLGKKSNITTWMHQS